MSEVGTFGCDPMVYDTMRELATHLGGLYVQCKRAATTAAERDRWADMVIAVRREAESVNVYDEARRLLAKFGLQAVQSLDEAVDVIARRINRRITIAEADMGSGV